MKPVFVRDECDIPEGFDGFAVRTKKTCHSSLRVPYNTSIN